MRYSLNIAHVNELVRLRRLLWIVLVNRPNMDVFEVNDCSKDLLHLNLPKSFWPIISWLYTTQYANAGAARNIRLRSDKSKYLLFEDSDDELLSGTFDEYVILEDELVNQ